MSLPIVLAGPLLRRSEPGRVCVWIATRVPVRVTGQIWDAAPVPVPRDRAAHAAGQAVTTAFGANLHVALVPITPLGEDTIPTGQLLEYDLTLELIDHRGVVVGGPVQLSTSPEFQKDNRISYPPFSRPTFHLPGKGDELNLLHGSCRKLHGDGEDALQSVDAILMSTTPGSFQSKATDLRYRPSALLLTGDQIYADDVAEDLAQPVIDLGRKLLGFPETVPAPGGTPIPVSRLTHGLRGQLLATIFTPDYATVAAKSSARNHLIGFGEFAAMYLLAWNPATWPAAVRGSSALAHAYRALPAIRRALANIPTYMILDDHEVTDDWNRTRAWQERVDTSPTGRRLITNAVAAYYVFQGWGNDPDRFPDSFARPLTDYLASHGENVDAYEKAFYPTNLDPNNPRGAQKPSVWSYVAPTHPPVVFLDCRTRRGYDPRRKDAPAQLLGAAAISDLRNVLATLDLARQPLIIVAQTPVLGIPKMDSFVESTFGQTAMGLYASQQGAAAIDLESWHANPTGFYRFLLTIQEAGATACVLLSGDVHYGYASAATLRNAATGKTTHFTQFTSSALKNRTPAAMRSRVQEWASREPVHTEFAVASSREVTAASYTAVEASPVSGRAQTPPPIKLVTQLARTAHTDFVIDDCNLGQLLLEGLGPSGSALLDFYPPDNDRPTVVLQLPLDRFKYED